MTLRPSRVVEQQLGIPLFVQKSKGRGRGHWGHKGRPGKVGGSLPGTGAATPVKRKSLAELVKTRPVESVRPEVSGIESTYVNDYGKEGKVLYKINSHGSAESELMVYEFSESIGWGIVPETIVPEGTKDVSVQRWMEGRTAHEIEMGDPTEILPRGQMAAWVGGMFRKTSQMVVMDALLGNRDRHRNNVLIEKTGRQWAIDNNQAFGAGIDRGTGRRVYDYGAIEGLTKGRRVTKDRADLIVAAKDVRRWFKTPAYYDYVAKLENTHGKAVARQFGLNVADLVDWSRKAKVVE